jgi:peptidoglycan/LPS O-acetylase OafA/YrhL
LIVVFYHCALTYFANEPPAWVLNSPLRLLVAGYGSVLVFFALSGFVLFLTFTNADRFQYYPYIVKRFTRIYLPFLLAILGSAVLYDLVEPSAIPLLGTWFNGNSWQAPPTTGLIAAHLAMTDRVGLQGLDNVMWSLCHEARIALLFPLVAVCVWRNWYATALATFAVSLISRHIDRSHAIDWLYDPFNTFQYLFLFAGGAALSLNAGAVRRRLGKAPAWVIALLWLTALVFITFPNKFFIAANCSAILLIALCLGDPRAEALLSRGVPRWLGRVSYSLYLVHLPVLLALVHLLWGKMPLPYILLSAVFLSLLVAELSYRLIEKPSIDLGRRVARLVGTAPPVRMPLEEAAVAGSAK